MIAATFDLRLMRRGASSTVPRSAAVIIANASEPHERPAIPSIRLDLLTGRPARRERPVAGQ